MSKENKGKGILDYCASCKEYGNIFRGYVKGLLGGDYNCWSGLGIVLDIILESRDIEPEILDAIGPICEKCDNDIGIYTKGDKLKKIKEWWEKENEKMSEMPPEETNDYLRKNFSEIMLEITLERFAKTLE